MAAARRDGRCIVSRVYGFMGWRCVVIRVRAMTVVVVLTLGAQVVVAFLFLRHRCYRPLPLICFGLLISGYIASLGVFWNWTHIWLT